MNVKVSTVADTSGSIAALPSPPAGRLAEVLLAELVRTLTAEARPGTVLGGRPHLRLFGEASDLALPLRARRRLAELAPAPSLELDEVTLRRHARAIADDQGYLLSPAGLYAAHGLGTRSDAGVAADALSLRLVSSPLSRPMNTLLRADPAEPTSWLRVVESLRHAAWCASDRDDLPPSHPFARRMARLRASLEGLHRLDDPRLPRLLGEQLVHAFMAVRALLRQRRVRREQARLDPPWLSCPLPDGMLAELRRVAAVEDGTVWRDTGLLSASLLAGRRRSRDPAEPDALEIRPRVHGSVGRWLDGSVDDVVSPGPMVLFPPGTPFEVLEVVDRGGVLVRVAELPSRRAASASR